MFLLVNNAVEPVTETKCRQLKKSQHTSESVKVAESFEKLLPHLNTHTVVVKCDPLDVG